MKSKWVVTRVILLLLLSALPFTALSLSLCRNSCGPISVSYPFGLDDGCGSPQFRRMLNCTVAGDLLFDTPSGAYKVRSIDYEKQSMVVYDPGMSTCNALQPRHDFAMSDIQWLLAPPSAATVFALLNCSIDSPVLNHYRGLCFNFSGHSCDEMYGTCTAFQIFRAAMGTAAGGKYPACCFTDYNTVKFMSMNILDCSHYTTVYNTENLKGVSPADWLYGMELSYTAPKSGCEQCQKSGGTCGYNTDTEGPVCVCSTFGNSTRECAGAGGGIGNLATGGGNTALISCAFFSLRTMVVIGLGLGLLV